MMINQFRILAVLFLFFCAVYACEDGQGRRTIGLKSSAKEHVFIPDEKYATKVFLHFLPTIHDEFIFNTEVESLGGKGYKVFLADLNGDSLMDAIIDYSLVPIFYGNAISEIGGLVYLKNTGGSLIVGNHTDKLGGNFGSRNDIQKIENGTIYMKMLEYAPDDGRCCPSIPKTTKVRIFNNGEFMLR